MNFNNNFKNNNLLLNLLTCIIDKSKETLENILNQDENNNIPEQEPKEQTKYKLLLRMKAKGYEDTIEKLRKKEKVTPEIWKDVYQATEVLWLGTKQDFEEHSTNLDEIFQRNETDQPSEYPEYDIYFVKITLDEPHSGFERNVTSLERADAFEALSKSNHEVEVSKRLPFESTDNQPPSLYR